MMAVAAAVIYHETRETTLRVDEWVWALQRRGDGLGTLLEPHNGHFSLVPLLLYKGLFATVGIEDFAPYRAMIILAHLLCTGLLYVYASRRIGAVAALLPAALLLTFGPGWHDILWPFQVAWLISLAAGLGALLALDGRRDAVACALVAVALASSGLGIAIAIGLLVEQLLRRRDWRDAWVVAGPLAAYGVWWLVYQDTDFWRHNVVVAPRFAADAASGALAAIAGLTEPRYDADGLIVDGGSALSWGRPLAVAAAVVLIWRLAALRPVAVRVPALLAMAAAFWLLTGLQRSQISPPDASRYLYVGALHPAARRRARARHPAAPVRGRAARLCGGARDRLQPGRPPCRRALPPRGVAGRQGGPRRARARPCRRAARLLRHALPGHPLRHDRRGGVLRRRA